MRYLTPLLVLLLGTCGRAQSFAFPDPVTRVYPLTAAYVEALLENEFGPRAVHRAYRRDRVAIFCDRLPAGTHTYTVRLEPRFTGNYTLNPARAELQYAAGVSGNGGMKEIRVVEY